MMGHYHLREQMTASITLFDPTDANDTDSWKSACKN